MGEVERKGEMLAAVTVEQVSMPDAPALVPGANTYAVNKYKQLHANIQKAREELRFAEKLSNLSPEEREKLLAEKAKIDKAEENRIDSILSAEPDSGAGIYANYSQEEIQELKQEAGKSFLQKFWDVAGPNGYVKPDDYIEYAKVAKEKVQKVVQDNTGVDIEEVLDQTASTLLRLDDTPDYESQLSEARNKLYAKEMHLKEYVESLEKLSPSKRYRQAFKNEQSIYSGPDLGDPLIAEALSFQATIAEIARYMADAEKDESLRSISDKILKNLSFAPEIPVEDYKLCGFKEGRYGISIPQGELNKFHLEMALKWGIEGNAEQIVFGQEVIRGITQLPKEYFKLRKAFTAYNSLSFVLEARDDLQRYLTKTEKNDSLTELQKVSERRKDWDYVVTQRLTGTREEVDANKEIKDPKKHLPAIVPRAGEQIQAAVINPILSSFDGAGPLTYEQASIFRIKLELDYRNSSSEQEKEKHNSIIKSYEIAKKRTRIGDDLVKASASELSNEELQTRLENYKNESPQSANRALFVLEEIENNMDLFISIHKAFNDVRNGLQAPDSIDKSIAKENGKFVATESFKTTVEPFDIVARELADIINNDLGMTSQEIYDLADEQEKLNREVQGLSKELENLPRMIKALLKKYSTTPHLNEVL